MGDRRDTWFHRGPGCDLGLETERLIQERLVSAGERQSAIVQ